jgi:hypothetical protein
MYGLIEYYNDPVAFDGSMPPDRDWYQPESATDQLHRNHLLCNYGQEAAREAAFAYSYLMTSGDLADKDSVAQRYVHTYLVEIIAHEVGHTLGFRHNFKASTIYTFDQINDPAFTSKHGTVGTIMDYAAANIAGPDKPQGDFYAPVPGPFDDWMAAYGYSDFGATDFRDEKAQLEQIASRAGEQTLVYGTDEDVIGWSTRSIDPYCNMHDIGADPLAFAERKVAQAKHIWGHALENFERAGNRYQKVHSAFQAGWRGYRELAMIASKYIGGLTRSNIHVGDAPGQAPFQVVPASEQRRAIALLRENLFAPDAFQLPEALLNRLQPERFYDFTGDVFSALSIDYPLHQTVLNTQQVALSRLYSPDVLGRLVNNLDRLPSGADRYTMLDLFGDVRKAIWSEVLTPANANSYRRQLQMAHLQTVISIFLGSAARYPADARTLAGNDLNIIETAAKRAVGAAGIDEMTRAHFQEVVRQITAAKDANREFLDGTVITRS